MRTLPNMVKYKDYECRIGISYYDSNPDRPAIVANDFHTGEPIVAFTRNFDDLAYYPPNEVAIDINNCGQEAQQALMDAGIIGPQTDEIRSGFCTYPCHKLLV